MRVRDGDTQGTHIWRLVLAHELRACASVSLGSRLIRIVSSPGEALWTQERGKHLYYKTQQFSLGFSPDVLHCLPEVKSKGLINAFPFSPKQGIIMMNRWRLRGGLRFMKEILTSTAMFLFNWAFLCLFFSAYYSPEK